MSMTPVPVDPAYAVRLPWKDPYWADLFQSSFETQVVHLTPEATVAVWEEYKKGRLPHKNRRGGQGKWPYMLFSFCGDLNSVETDYNEALAKAVILGLVGYTIKSGKGWRPVWSEQDPAQRIATKFTIASAQIYGYKGMIEGWEVRPRAKLFAND